MDKHRPRQTDTLLRPNTDGMVAADKRAALEKRSTDVQPTGAKPGPSRRQILTGATALGGVAAASLMPDKASAATPGAVDYPVQADPSSEFGRPGFADGGYGSRSQFEKEIRWLVPVAEVTFSPLASSMGIITPSGLHFERHHAGIPNIDPEKHVLIVHGMVDKPVKFTMEDLKRFPSVSRMHFIECSGNSFPNYSKDGFEIAKTVQKIHGLVSTSEWTGVPLSTILREAGVKDGAAWVVAEGADGSNLNRSIPIGKAWEDAILAYGQNGEAIRPEQGYPLRLMLPGWEGNAQVKWLHRLEITDKPNMSRWETSKYTDLVKDGKAQQFTFTMEAKSVITSPSGEMSLPAPGYYEITGLAWSGRGRVKRVEVSTDGGTSWQIAELQGPILPLCTTRFSLPWRWDGKPAILMSRCQDETGYIQPTIKELVAARSLDGGTFGPFYHMNAIQPWSVDKDGNVKDGNADVY